jgi:hypothetical protein
MLEETMNHLLWEFHVRVDGKDVGTPSFQRRSKCPLSDLRQKTSLGEDETQLL